MTASRVALWAAYWLAIATVAALAARLTDCAFPPAVAQPAALTVIGGICLIGLATAPYTTRKDVRP